MGGEGWFEGPRRTNSIIGELVVRGRDARPFPQLEVDAVGRLVVEVKVVLGGHRAPRGARKGRARVVGAVGGADVGGGRQGRRRRAGRGRRRRQGRWRRRLLCTPVPQERLKIRARFKRRDAVNFLVNARGPQLACHITRRVIDGAGRVAKAWAARAAHLARCHARTLRGVVGGWRVSSARVRKRQRGRRIVSRVGLANAAK